MKVKDLHFRKAMCAALLVLLLNVVGLTNALAQDFTIDDLNYSVNYDGVTVTGHVDGQNATGLLMIPGIVTFEGTDYYVTQIGDEAFYNCNGLSDNLIIPITVTTIGFGAFAGCSGFTGNLIIPNSVTTIGYSAFAGCSGFTGSLTIPNSVTTIEEAAFYGCKGFNGDLTIPSSVTSIGMDAFYECPLEYITVAEDNTVYDSRDNCNAVIETSTNELLIGSSNSVIPNSVTSIGQNAFYGCTGLTSVTIPNSVTSINSGAFRGCSGLISLTIGNSVEVIGDYAFEDCTNIFCVTVLAETPPAVNEYGNVFGSLSTDTPIYVPCGFEEAYASYSWGGFSNFHGLCGGTVTVVADPAEVGMVSGGGIFEADQTCTVMATPLEGYTFATWTLNGIVVSINAEYTFYVDSDMTIVAHFVPDANIIFADANVKSICVASWDTNNDGELSYAEAASVKSLGDVFRLNKEIVSFNELQYFIGLSSIGLNASSNVYCSFDGCSGLTSIILPNSLNSIDDYAFYGCNSLTGSLTIPNSVTSIGRWAFYHCGWTSVTMGNSVTKISNSAFLSCNNLTTVTYGNSVNWIGSEAFAGSSLNAVYYLGDINQWCKIFFYDVFSNPLYYAHNLYINNELLTDLVIPETVTRIKQFAFEGATCLTSLTIPNSVTVIEQRAFSSCTNLESITVFAGTPPALSSSSFSGVDKSIPVYVPCGSLEAYQTATVWSDFTNIQESCSQQTFTLSQGWNWFSTYIEVDDPVTMLQMVEASLDENGIQIKSSLVNTEYDSEWGWFGDLDDVGMTNEQMYAINVSAPCTVTLEGMPANPANHPITIVHGWNWIGFPSGVAISLEEAFAGFAIEGDKIKNRVTQIEYDPEWGWYGDFETLEPGQGYMYYSASSTSRTLVFPVGAK
jgi:hypothetical protein